MKGWRVFLVASVLLSLAPVSIGPASADRMLVWNIVTLKCLRHLAKSEAPIPCDFVDVSDGEERGVALLKDSEGVGRMLAIPTRRVTGIEDPALLGSDTPNYFTAAWSARSLVERRLRRKLPREAVAIAVDSALSRDQDQLSLVIDCVDEGVAAALRAHQDEIGDDWRQMSVELKGRRYWARRLVSSDLIAPSPFQLIAEAIPGAGRDMSNWSLAAIGADLGGRPGFILLADKLEAGRGARATDLQDRDCAIATSGL